METHMAYCPRCKRAVRVGFTPTPLHGGQATLPDAHELVCLDTGPGCRGDVCPLCNMPASVMQFRLDRFGKEIVP